MAYKYLFSAIQCDKKISAFMRGCDVGVDGVGIGVKLSFVSDKLLTDEEVQKLIDYLKSSKQRKELEVYLDVVKLEEIEVLGDEKQ